MVSIDTVRLKCCLLCALGDVAMAYLLGMCIICVQVAIICLEGERVGNYSEVEVLSAVCIRG